MYTISNDKLKVFILDPVNDVCHLGSRYCTGGYIWQVQDQTNGNLLCGPHYPASHPPPFDGQGAPEIFESAPEAELKPLGDLVLIPGVGLIRKTDSSEPFHVKNNPEVDTFCTWNISVHDYIVIMKALQSYGNYQSEITRTIMLSNTLVTSKTSFSYLGSKPFHLRWFAHPFFPLNNNCLCCSFSIPVGISENHAFYINSENILSIKKTIDRSKSSYTLLKIPTNNRMIINQIHPICGNVVISPDFNLSKAPVWTNEFTFSIEPYFEKTLQSGEHISWGISYKF